MGYLIKSSWGGCAVLQQEHRVSRGRQVILSCEIVSYVKEYDFNSNEIPVSLGMLLIIS